MTPSHPRLPPELQLHILTLSLPPPTQHRTLCVVFSRFSLVSPLWRHAAQAILFGRLRYVLGWRQYGHTVGRHFRALGKAADEYKARKVGDRLRWLKARGVVLRQVEVSLLLFVLPDRVRNEEDEVWRLVKEMGETVEEVTVKYDPEGAVRLDEFLTAFPRVRRLYLQSETMSDPPTLPCSFFSSSPSGFKPNPAPPPPLPPLLSTLKHLYLTRIAFDRFPPSPLPSLLALSLTDVTFNSSSLPSSTIDSLFSFSPSLVVFSWVSRSPRLTRATFANAPLSLQSVTLSDSGRLPDSTRLLRAVRAFPGALGSLALVGFEKKHPGMGLGNVKAWCKAKGTFFSIRDSSEDEGWEDDFEEDNPEDEPSLHLPSATILFSRLLPSARALPLRAQPILPLFPTRTLTTSSAYPSKMAAATHHTDANCIFCKIVKGDIPSFKLVETESVLSFLDVGPLSKGHALVIPKYHGVKLHDIPDEHLGELLVVAKKVAVAQGLENYNILQNNGKIAHQVVEHVHFHVIPKPSASDDEGLVIGWPTKPADMDALKKYAEELKSRL
ncbi:hypothetical protein JCM8547_004262 [Rhodosporidiobolus lusitaniae]